MRSLLMISLLVSVLTVRAAHAEEGIAWPHLRELDELAEQAEQGVEKNDTASLRALLPKLAAKAKQVATDPLPEGVHQAKQTKALQNDLLALVPELSATDLEDQQVRDLAEGVHPIVVALMEAAGLPHVHEDEAEEGGDHHEHEHHHAPAAGH